MTESDEFTKFDLLLTIKTLLRLPKEFQEVYLKTLEQVEREHREKEAEEVKQDE